MNINADWHRVNPMPKNPTLDQRLKWHLAHAQHCSCRDIPESIKVEMKKRKMVVPKRKKTGSK